MQNRVVKRKGRKVALIRDSGVLTERRSQIAEAALDLFLGSGYHNTNVREIALASKISVGSLFNYFTNKEEILFYVLDHGHKAIETGLTELTDKLNQWISESRSAEEVMAEICARYIWMTHQSRRFTLLAYQETKSLVAKSREELFERERRVLAMLERAVLYGADQGAWSAQDARLKASAVVMIGHSWAIRQWLWRREIPSIEEFINRNVGIVLDLVSGKRSTNYVFSLDQLGVLKGERQILASRD